MVTAVRLVGSRAEGRATRCSDWDFVVETSDFDAVATGILDAAVADHLTARTQLETALDVRVPRALERVVRPAIADFSADGLKEAP